MKILGLKTVMIRAVLACGLGRIGWVRGTDGQVPSGQTSAKRPMTFADLMAMKRVSDPQISPSGKWVMFSVTDVSLEKNTKVNHLWVVGLDGGDAIPRSSLRSGTGSRRRRQVTFADGETFGRFSPDGKSVSLTLKDQIYAGAMG